jgi:hypothetical protein
MLTHTFCHIPYISLDSEYQLWDAGIHSWEDFCRDRNRVDSSERVKNALKHIEDSIANLSNNNISYFTNLLPPGLHWRLFPEFRNTIAYLDIETTGLSAWNGDHITTIAVYNGSEVFHYVQGQNLVDFPRDIRNYKLLVTYNGKQFDVPFIERYFGTHIEAEHIDLRYLLKNLGYTGGLKGCERKLGLHRNDLADVDGFFAVLLWNDYKRRKNKKALETLLAYNIRDVVNLETLTVIAYNMKLQETPFSPQLELPMPEMPRIQFKADRETIERIRGERFAW